MYMMHVSSFISFCEVRKTITLWNDYCIKNNIYKTLLSKPKINKLHTIYYAAEHGEQRTYMCKALVSHSFSITVIAVTAVFINYEKRLQFYVFFFELSSKLDIQTLIKKTSVNPVKNIFDFEKVSNLVMNLE